MKAKSFEVVVSLKEFFVGDTEVPVSWMIFEVKVAPDGTVAVRLYLWGRQLYPDVKFVLEPEHVEAE